jgi:TRAP-type C4-dicarboxylate transport system permease small subunit
MPRIQADGVERSQADAPRSSASDVSVTEGAETPRRGEEGLPAWLRVADRWLAVAERAFGFIAVLTLILLILNTAVNAVTRNLWSVQIPGSQNITILYFLPALVFLGLTVVQANDSHISATLVVERFGKTGQRVCKIVTNVLIVVACFLMSTGAWGELARAWGSSLGGSPDLPVGPSWMLVPVGLAIVMLRAVQQVIVHSLTDVEGKKATEALSSTEMTGDRHA